MELTRSQCVRGAATCSLMLMAALIVMALPAEALAADSGASWRPTFDLVMRWLNFLILFFIIIKFSRAPIKSFLENKKQEVAVQIKALEAQKRKIVGDIDRSQQQLENSRGRLEQLKKKILADGEKNRQKIIKEAENESKLMLKSAGQKMNNRIEEAKNEIKAELVDLAVSIAMQKLPAQMTEQDNQKFIDTFLDETSK